MQKTNENYSYKRHSVRGGKIEVARSKKIWWKRQARNWQILVNAYNHLIIYHFSIIEELRMEQKGRKYMVSFYSIQYETKMTRRAQQQGCFKLLNSHCLLQLKDGPTKWKIIQRRAFHMEGILYLFLHYGIGGHVGILCLTRHFPKTTSYWYLWFIKIIM